MANQVKALISERDGVELEFQEELNPNTDHLNVGGITLPNSVVFTQGADDPSSVGYAAGVGSLYVQTDGTLWSKTGAGDTDWVSITAGGADEDFVVAMAVSLGGGC